MKDTARGDEAVARIMKLINEKAESLKKYHI
jgi:4-hydroxy-tetrahydrodipicolinate synthase